MRNFLRTTAKILESTFGPKRVVHACRPNAMTQFSGPGKKAIRPNPIFWLSPASSFGTLLANQADDNALITDHNAMVASIDPRGLGLPLDIWGDEVERLIEARALVFSSGIFRSSVHLLITCHSMPPGVR
ncbi:hypothetical protein NUH87_28720 [Pseudomonas batumici]|uniref:hypothetical protein n=1 Tax=Pseudomonas batumici TaxID=226910 RepID=UPI0030D0E558